MAFFICLVASKRKQKIKTPSKAKWTVGLKKSWSFLSGWLIEINFIWHSICLCLCLFTVKKKNFKKEEENWQMSVSVWYGVRLCKFRYRQPHVTRLKANTQLNIYINDRTQGSEISISTVGQLPWQQNSMHWRPVAIGTNSQRRKERWNKTATETARSDQVRKKSSRLMSQKQRRRMRDLRRPREPWP